MLFDGFWNGEPAKYRALLVEIVESDKEMPLLYWGRTFVGQFRQIIEVHYRPEPFYIDNEDGLGYTKVTKGLGSPPFGHRVIYGHKIMHELLPEETNREFSEEKYMEIQNACDRWLESTHPEEYSRLLKAREAIKKQREERLKK